MTDYDNTNSGALFPLRDSFQVVRQGNLDIDGENNRVILVSRNNREGEPIFELYRAIGTLKQNQNKTSEKAPDTKGMVEKLSTSSVKSISGWKRTSGKGIEFTSLSVSDIQKPQQDSQVETAASSSFEDDEIPF